MKINWGCRSTAFFIGYLSLLVAHPNAIVHGFATTQTNHQQRALATPPSSFAKPTITTSCQDGSALGSSSLDAGYNDALTSAVDSATSSTIMPSAVLKSLQAVQWDQVFSAEGFKALSQATQDMIVLMAQMPLWLEATMVLIPAVVIAHLHLYRLSYPTLGYRQGMEPYPRGAYDPVRARAYYGRHPLLVAQRLAELLRLMNHWLFHFLLEKYIFKNEEENRQERAQELLALITHLGPTAVKIGQALSVRSDILPEEYAQALSTLQDAVPPFDSERAQQIIRRELGPEKYDQLRAGIEKGPVASASIGQVYKCTLKGKEVAVKVQRPDVLAEISLDLYLARELAPLYQKFARSPTDFQVLANEWGRGFIAELDYRKEAENTIEFNQEMTKRKLTAVCAPQVVLDYSTERILVTEWVHGTRLDQSPDVQDIPRLCSVALNAYLVMLLETSKLHSDPHPGNLLRTPDGRLCILDFGMVLDIDKSLQYSLLEYVAHLTSEDYDQLPEDMAKLGFLRADKVEFVRRSGVLEPLKYFLQQAGQGGGASQVRERIFDDLRAKYPGRTEAQLKTIMRKEMEQHFQDIVQRESVATGITVEIEELQRQNEDAFRIPEWFVYTSRAFLTLEGVSLAANEDYSLVKSCFPYIAKRLMADNDPRAAKALRDILYGAGSNIDVKRLADLADGFQSYTATTRSVNARESAVESLIPATGGTVSLSDIEREAKRVEAEAAITLAKDSADILLNPKGNLVQSLLVDESVLAASARFKDSLRSAVSASEQFRESLPLGVGKLFPPLPFETHVRKQLEPFIEKTAEESKALELAIKIGELISTKSLASRRETVTLLTKFVSDVREMDPEQVALVLRELRENLPKYAPHVDILGKKLFSNLLQKASSNIEGTLDKSPPRGMIGVTAKGLSSAAQQGVKALSWRKNQFSLDDPKVPPTVMQIKISGNSTFV